MTVLAALIQVRADASDIRRTGEGVSIGSIHSPKGVGLCADIEHSCSSFSSLTVTADLIDILDGTSSTPGIKFSYHYNLICSSYKDGKYILYGGPGLTSGYVRNIDNNFGFMAGISGDFGFQALCLKSITVAVELQADFSLIFKNRISPYMSLYNAGFNHFYFPHFKLMYRF